MDGHDSWKESCISPMPVMLTSTSLNNYVYSYCWNENVGHEFFRSASMELTKDVHLLNSPLKQAFCDPEVCALRDHVYMETFPEIFSYNPERDQWFNETPMNILDNNKNYPIMMADNICNVLYMVSSSGYLQAYDNRASKWLELRKLEHYYCYSGFYIIKKKHRNYILSLI